MNSDLKKNVLPKNCVLKISVDFWHFFERKSHWQGSFFSFLNDHAIKYQKYWYWYVYRLNSTRISKSFKKYQVEHWTYIPCFVLCSLHSHSTKNVAFKNFLHSKFDADIPQLDQLTRILKWRCHKKNIIYQRGWDNSAVE